jgi:hypothetical protein
MPEPVSLLILIALAGFNLGLAKICWDFIWNTEDRGHKIRAGIGVATTLASAFVCILFLITYLTL